MPRRALKSPEELRELILSEARNIIEEHGTYTLSAREIAKAINYSPGTLYNAFKNIDDIKWGVETNILHELHDHIKAHQEQAGKASKPELADTFLEFVDQHEKVWPLLIDELPKRRAHQPELHTQTLAGITETVDENVRSAEGFAESKQAKLADDQVSSDLAEDVLIALYAVSVLKATGRLQTLTNRSSNEIAHRFVNALSRD